MRARPVVERFAPAPVDALEPDIVLPGQFDGNPEETPIRKLMRGMLEEAMTCLRGETPSGLEAMRWFRSDRESWGSFLFVCEELGYSPTRVRVYVRAIWERRVRFRKIHRVSGTRTNLSRRRV